MKKLFIDTCAGSLGIGVITDTQTLMVEEAAGKKTAEDLFPTLLNLLNQASCSLKDIDSIFVTRGPGSYTGERLGLTVAKVIATLNSSVDIYTISTLKCLSSGKGQEAILLDARNSAYFAGFYNDGKLVGEEYRAPIEDVQAKLNEGYKIVINKHDKNAKVSLSAYEYVEKSILEGMMKLNTSDFTHEEEPLKMTPIYMHGKDRD